MGHAKEKNKAAGSVVWKCLGERGENAGRSAREPWGRAFQAARTANAKALQLQGTGGRQGGWTGVNEAGRITGVEIQGKYFAKGHQSMSLGKCKTKL